MISFVIVSYRSKEILSECMTALASQVQKGDEVIVVENGQDKSLSEMGVFGREDFHLVFNEENVGYSKGCNQGLALASNDWVVLLNPDTQPLIDSVSKLKLGLAKAQEGDMFSLELVNPDGTRQDYYRRFPSVRALLSCFLCRQSIKDSFRLIGSTCTRANWRVVTLTNNLRVQGLLFIAARGLTKTFFSMEVI